MFIKWLLGGGRGKQKGFEHFRIRETLHIDSLKQGIPLQHICFKIPKETFLKLFPLFRYWQAIMNFKNIFSQKTATNNYFVP